MFADKMTTNATQDITLCTQDTNCVYKMLTCAQKVQIYTYKMPACVTRC